MKMHDRLIISYWPSPSPAAAPVCRARVDEASAGPHICLVVYDSSQVVHMKTHHTHCCEPSSQLFSCPVLRVARRIRLRREDIAAPQCPGHSSSDERGEGFKTGHLLVSIQKQVWFHACKVVEIPITAFCKRVSLEVLSCVRVVFGSSLPWNAQHCLLESAWFKDDT